MKIAISSKGKDLNSEVDSVFGRCRYFLIANIKDKKVINLESFKNPGIDKPSGAGIIAAKALTEKEVEAVISVNFGPKTADVLRQFDIKMYKGAGLSKDILQSFIDGKLMEEK